MKVLLVDEDPQIVKMLQKALVSAKFAIDIARDGDEAIAKAKRGSYVLIVLDLMLPKRNGFEVITYLRSTGIDTPILVTSARSLVEDRVKAIDMGADDYMVKYFSLDEFLSRVKALIRRPTGLRRNVIQVGELTIDLSNLSVRKNGELVILSRKEFSILNEFIRHKNEIVTRSQLIESVWGERECDIFSNTVDVHVRSLRRKLGDRSGKAGQLRTVRGYGYMLVDGE